MLLLFYRTMAHQKKQFDEILRREAPETRAHEVIGQLCKSTGWTLYGFTFFY
jgi:hypothetical protein